MHDLRWIRENPDAFDNALARRGIDAAAQLILELDETRRRIQTDLQAMQEQRNAASKEIASAMSDGRADAAEAQKAQVGALKGSLIFRLCGVLKGS